MAIKPKTYREGYHRSDFTLSDTRVFGIAEAHRITAPLVKPNLAGKNHHPLFDMNLDPGVSQHRRLPDLCLDLAQQEFIVFPEAFQCIGDLRVFNPPMSQFCTSKF